jgi:hypothetical protein
MLSGSAYNVKLLIWEIHKSARANTPISRSIMPVV